MNLAGTVRIFVDDNSIVAAIDWRGEQLRWKLDHDSRELDEFKDVWALVVADIKSREGK